MNKTKWVKEIAERLDDIVNGDMYYCPNCGIYHFSDDVPTDDETESVYCPDCESEGIYSADLLDYLTDNYGVEYRVDGKDRDYINSVRICTAYGGPSVYIDTADKKVKLYWWGDYAEAEFSQEAANAINEVFTEIWNC